MKRTRHKAEKIIGKPKVAEKLIALGRTIADVSHVINSYKPTKHGSRQQYWCMQTGETRRLNMLEK